jgi:cytochrome c553
MTRIRWVIAILAVFASAGQSWSGDSDPASVRNCTWCHGTSAQGYTVAPRLAGQRPQYLEEQLRSLREHTRDNPFSKQYMWDAAGALRSNAPRELAMYFASLSPKAANDGHREIAARGQTIYLEGIPEANIVSCIACHGPDAEGVRQIPRLGGLSYYYLKSRLEQWGEGYHSGSDSPMPRVASRLGPSEIEALASYLSFVK